MARDILRVDGVSADLKKQLQAAALQKFGKASASELVRHLILEHLAKEKKQTSPAMKVTAQSEPSKRLEIRLPVSVYSEITKRADAKFSDRNYYVKSLIYEHIGQPQLHGDEIELLRKSNYEIAKIGSNLNQVAKAFNILVKMGGGGKLPELGKKMASLKKDINEHTHKVLRVLNARTVVFEAKGRGQKQKKTEKK